MELIKTLPIPSGRVIAISDVHGEVSLLRRLIAKAAPRGGDLIVFVGDMTDKGADSLATLRYVKELCDKGLAAAVPGNCDVTKEGVELSSDGELYARLKEREQNWDSRSLLWDMAREAGLRTSSLGDMPALRRGLLARYARELGFISSLPLAIEIGEYRFVHAGAPSDDVSQWTRKGCLMVDAFLDGAPSFNKTMVVGHWPTTLYNKSRLDYSPVADGERRIISIDGANVLHRWGQLNALIIDDPSDGDAFSWISEDGYPVVTAKSAQEASPASRAVYYNEPMELIGTRGRLALCRVKADRYEMLIPSDHLYGRGGEYFVSGMTDYLLPVEKGEKYTLLWEEEGMYALKKDGVAGWYKGEIER